VAVQTQGGLANRLRAFASFAVVGLRSGCRITVFWPRDHSCASLWHELFEPVPGVTFANGRAPGGVPRTWSVHKDLRSGVKSLSPYILEYVRPIPALRKRIDDFRAQLGTGGGDFAAVHIRRTDLSDNYTEDAAFATWAMQGLTGGRKVFVASDNPVSLNTMRERLGADRVVAIGNFINLETFDPKKGIAFHKVRRQGPNKKSAAVLLDMPRPTHFFFTARLVVHSEPVQCDETQDDS
jgi:hypothetical protein